MEDMELRRLELGGYKCFDGDTSVEIAPLTILMGANNSGKTALARSIHLFASSLALPNGDGQKPLLLNSEGIRHGRTFQDLVTRRSAHGQLSLSVVLGNGGDEVQLSVKVQNVVRPSKPSESEQQLNYWSLRNQNDEVEAIRESLNEEAPYRIAVSGVIQDQQQVNWRGLLPRKPNTFPDWANEEIDSIREWASGVRYLKCPRSFPASRLARNDYLPAFHDATGATAPRLFAADDDLRDSVREWYRRVFGVSIEMKTQADYFDLTTGSQYYGTNVAMHQSGDGLTQVLPVAVAAFTAKRRGPGVDIIEHPEAELHPAVQADVAELLINNLPGSTRPIIIETHSEMILLRIRRLVAEGKLPNDQVIVYWIHAQPGYGSKLQQISITDEGAMSGWPEGLFCEDYEEILAIRRAARNRANNAKAYRN